MGTYAYSLSKNTLNDLENIYDNKFDDKFVDNDVQWCSEIKLAELISPINECTWVNRLSVYGQSKYWLVTAV